MRIAIVAIAAVMALGAVSASGSAPRRGDVDCSGDISPNDALVILQEDAGYKTADCIEDADANCDGEVNPIDSLKVLRFDAHLDLEYLLIFDCPGAPTPR